MRLLSVLLADDSKRSTPESGGRPSVPSLLLHACLLSTLAFLPVACDSSPPGEEDVACRTLSECTTLRGFSQALDGNFRASDAVATDEAVYVALTSFTARFASSGTEHDEVYVLSRPLGSNADSSNWRIENLSRSPDTPSGANEGTPTLARGPGGDVNILWGEITDLGGLPAPDRIMHATRPPDPGGEWSTPDVAYDMPRSPRLSGGMLPAAMALGGPGNSLYAAFRDPGTSTRGRVAVMKLPNGGNAWAEPIFPFSEKSAWPDLTSTAEGKLLVSYLAYPSIDVEGPAGLLFSSSDDGGETWTDSEVVMPLESTSDGDPLLKVTDSRITQTSSGAYHILFDYDLGDDEPGGNDPFEDQVWHTYSTDEGETWTQPRPINTSERGDILSLEVAVDGNENVHAFYYLTPRFASPTGNQLRHAVWNGQQWEQRANVSEEDIFHTGQAALGLGTGPNGCLHLSWSETIERDEDEPAKAKTRLRYRQIESGGVCK